MPGCWKDWNGLEEVTEVTAFWVEGIQGLPTCSLELQELGGLYLGVLLAWTIHGTLRTPAQFTSSASLFHS